MKIVDKKEIIIFFNIIFFIIFSLPNVCGQQPVASPSHPLQNGDSQIAKYVDDSASLLLPETATAIASDCIEIEKVTNIRVLVKTLRVKNLNNSQTLVDTFFSEWIRNINMDKRGILLFALLPEGAVQGKVHLRVGIGLKYLITKEMGEKILNQVILPNNINNKDGAGFLEGVVAIRRMLLDELKREGAAVSIEGPQVFDLQKFLWASKEVLLTILIGLFLFYIIFFVERCPRCNSSLKVSCEVLKEPGNKTLGLQRKIYSCERCGFSRRKKEPIYPSGKTGLMMRITGARRNVRIE